jgi:uncharacterized membrane-anchored protein
MSTALRRLALGVFGLVTLGAGSMAAQDSAAMARFQAIPWEDGPIDGALAEAQVKVPEGCRFAGSEGTRQFLEFTENPVSGNERGVLLCRGAEGQRSWFVIFTFDDIGYVKDEEKDELDPDRILASLREGNDAGNAERLERGWETISLDGWVREPYYDPNTNNLTWATVISTQSGDRSVNHSVRLLGRGGVMNADLVIDPEAFESAMPAFDSVIAGFGYLPGKRYAEWRDGDKVAAIGLTALVAGGVGVAAGKAGLFAKLGKLLAAGGKAIVVGLLAGIAGLRALFKRKQNGPTAA